jgi:hypothetical protein
VPLQGACFACALLAAATAQAQTYTRTEITVYGATGVTLTCLNNKVTVGGYYQIGHHNRGFLASRGTVSELPPFTVPGVGKAYPFPSTINDAGEVLETAPAGSTYYAATSRPGHTPTGFAFPSVSGANGFGAVALNRAGTLVLDLITLADPYANISFAACSYIGMPSNFTEIQAPVGTPSGTSLEADALNDSGEVAGIVYPATASPTQYFIAGPAGTQFYSLPGTPSLGGSLQLNNLGLVAVVVNDSKGSGTVFVGKPGHLQPVTLSHKAYNLSVLGLNKKGVVAITYSQATEFGAPVNLSLLMPSGEYYIAQRRFPDFLSAAGLNDYGDLAYNEETNGVGHAYVATCSGC